MPGSHYSSPVIQRVNPVQCWTGSYRLHYSSIGNTIVTMISRKEFKNCFKTVQLLLLEEVTDVVEEELKKEKRIWVRNWISERNIKGGSTMLLRQLESEDPSEYRLAMRMTAENFEELLSLISNNIQRSDTLFRDAIPAKIKLEITLSFLSTGNSYRSLSHLFRLPKSSISQIIPEVCQEIKRALKDHMKVRNFLYYNFPHSYLTLFRLSIIESVHNNIGVFCVFTQYIK